MGVVGNPHVAQKPPQSILVHLFDLTWLYGFRISMMSHVKNIWSIIL